jgi:ComF family protein
MARLGNPSPESGAILRSGRRGGQRLIERLTTTLLDLALPRRCLGCRARGEWVCRECARELPRLPDGRCRVCAVPLAGTLVCPSCYRRRPRFDAIHAPYRHDGLARELVHALKYDCQRHLARPLAEAALAAFAPPLPAELVMAVPLHPTRQLERGFNQSALLARVIARGLGLELRDGLARVRATSSQTGLSPDERARNVRGAFAASGELPGARVVLVDDVCTTGATLDAAAAALRRAGATRVDALVVTRAVNPL